MKSHLLGEVKNPNKQLYLRNTFLNISKKYIYFISISSCQPSPIEFR